MAGTTLVLRAHRLPAGIVIRAMTLRDYEAVLALWRATPGIRLYGDDDSRPAIARYLRRNRGLSWVACQEGRIVGAVLVGHDGRRGGLYHLAVAPSCRRHGVGRALVAAGLRALAAQRIGKCNIFVMGSNRSGLHFWQRGGWILRRETPWLQHPTTGV